eukprot:GHVR01098161.1.p2 GENE.GHVR01098161.1~~GHVR01098161.1.p2  ORF type:complete len:265 (-),score=69.54 GHVR01098161.1:454-1248(-)
MATSTTAAVPAPPTSGSAPSHGDGPLVALHHCDPSKLRVGDVVGCAVFYRVMDVGDGRSRNIRLRVMHGTSFSDVETGVLTDEFCDTNVSETRTVNATRLSEVLLASAGNPVRVGFLKKQTAARRKDMICSLKPEDLPTDGEPARASNSKKRRLAAFAERMSHGELRVLTGRLLHSGTGGTAGGIVGQRVRMEDFYADPDPSTGDRQRWVDTRELLWVDVRGVRYILQTYKGPCDGGEIPRHSGSVDYRGVDAPPVVRRPRTSR